MPVEALLTHAPIYSSQWMAALVAAMPQIIIYLLIYTLIYDPLYPSVTRHTLAGKGSFLVTCPEHGRNIFQGREDVKQGSQQKQSEFT